MKKWIAITLSCALLLSLTACAQNTPTEPTEEECMHEYVVSETAGIFADKQKTSVCSKCAQTITDSVAPASKSVKILSIGNSFSRNSVDMVYEIAKSAGAENVVAACLWIGGSSLDDHATNILYESPKYEYDLNDNGTWTVQNGWTYLQGLQAQDWDYILINQVSVQSGRAEHYGKALKIVAEYIREHMPEDCQLWWNMTWSYDPDCTYQQAKFQEYYQCDSDIMYGCITQVAQNTVMPTGYFDGITFNGTVVQNMRTSWAKDFVTADGFHMSFDMGCYAVSLGTLAAITDIDISAVTYFSAKGSFAQQLKQIADEAVLNAKNTPFSVTQSQYTDR